MMPEIDYPPEVTSIVIAGQNDDAGRVAVDKAETSLLARGFAVRTIWPAAAFKTETISCEASDHERRVRQ